jgi:hypothetical protein
MRKQRAESREQRTRKHNLSLRGGVPSPVIARSVATKQSQDRLRIGSTTSKREIHRGVYPEQGNEILRSAQNDRRRARNAIFRIFFNEKGITLVIVMILSLISLAIIASLIFMITTGTQISGIQKRYKTSLEAGMGGADVTYQVISFRGDPSIPGLVGFNIPAENVGGVNCLNSKLNNSTSSWPAACDNTLTIDSNNTNTYDVTLQLGANPTWDVYAKIVDTAEGNSSPDLGLVKTGVVSAGTGEVPVASIPYLYTLEVYSENQANPSERAQLSILYQY